MKILVKNWMFYLASAALLTLYGCGSGGGAGGLPAPPPTPAAITLSGVAATGAAFTDAVVKVLDSTGATVGTSSPVGADGIFSVTLSNGAKPPFVLIASRTTAGGEVQSLVSVLEATSATIANITPITNLIASRLSPSGDPLKLATELASGTAQITPATVAMTVAEVKQILATLLTATGTTDFNPLTAGFVVDGTGYDRLLDSIQISIIPSGLTSSNIEISVKQALADGTQPVAVQFASIDTTSPPLPAVNSSTLVASGTSILISDLLRNLTACYSLPLAERVTAGGSTAANIIANACKNVFFGNNPASYLSNGSVVGLNKSFNGIFTNSGTGVVFSQGTYEFSRANGDQVIGYRSVSTVNNETFDTLTVRLDNDGKLKLIGNQYTYPGGINPYHQLRQFIKLNQSSRNYYSTGYDVNITDVKGGTGVGGSIFDRVVVTSPLGNTIAFKPSIGSSNLNIVLPVSQTVSGTSYIRMRSVFADLKVTGDISLMEPGLFFASPQFIDFDLTAIPSQGEWKFEYYLASAPTLIDRTQYYKTRTRALSMLELRFRGWAKLTENVIADIQTRADPFISSIEGQIPLPTNGPIKDVNFSVPINALPVTQIKVFGRMYTTVAGPRFDDEERIGSTLRTGSVSCSRSSDLDLHCGVVAGSYATGAYANGLHLFARDASGRGYASFYAMYKLP